MNNVLVIGSGGRCHAIVDALHRSPSVGKIYCAGGNPGIARYAELVPIKETDIAALRDWALEHRIDLTVVGPEVPLSLGIADLFRQSGLAIFGHTQQATRIESSKEFAKQIMQAAGVPTAAYRSFCDYNEALDYVLGRPFPTVIKYDGLAAGKGVVIAETPQEAQAALKDMLLNGTFGGDKVVIEDFLQGPEFSFMCFVNGRQVVPMPVAQDHKRAFDGDEGPNTGGMGAYTSLPFITDEDRQFALSHILQPVADRMADIGCPLSGVLYGGLIKTPQGIKVIEFNARFGDPETEVVLPLLESDIYPMLHAVATGAELPALTWSDKAVFGVVLASKGYPGKYDKGAVISGVDDVDCTVYHMGTALKDGQLLTAGGRVLMVIASADNLASAKEHVYGQIAKIDCPQLFHRTDIGHRAIASPTVIDGKRIAEKIKAEVRSEVDRIKDEGRRTPSLAVILVGDNPASQAYVRGKLKACEMTGIESRLVTLPDTTTEQQLLHHIEILNNDPAVDGILVQLPLPKGIDSDKVIDAIHPDKDVDGFHPLNVAALWNGHAQLLPCTPAGIMYMLGQQSVELDGKLAVVVGRSNIVGKPIAKLLLDANATVVIAHSRTRNLEEITRQADILVVAVGRKHFIDSRHVKKGAAVIDVGINRGEDGKLYGDVDFADVLPLASCITPVPGGVGPLTIAMLMKNTIICYNKLNKEQ